MYPALGPFHDSYLNGQHFHLYNLRPLVLLELVFCSHQHLEHHLFPPRPHTGVTQTKACKESLEKCESLGRLYSMLFICIFFYLFVAVFAPPRPFWTSQGINGAPSCATGAVPDSPLMRKGKQTDFDGNHEVDNPFFGGWPS